MPVKRLARICRSAVAYNKAAGWVPAVMLVALVVFVTLALT